MAEIVGIGRHGQSGYFSLRELPQQPSVASSTLSTGWWELDQIFKMYPGQFVVVTGLAGSGKSTFLLNVLLNMAREHGTASFMYVPENEQRLREKLRLLWTGNDASFQHYCDFQCFIQSAVPDYYDDEPKTLHWILSQAVAAIEKDRVDVILLDPWNELERAKPRDMLLTDYIGQCLMYLKQFCRAHAITIILVAHPTKAGVDGGKQPALSDIEGSMNWYNKCDNGLILVRDQGKNTSRVISAKVREIGAGKIGECHFYVDPETGKFTPQVGGVIEHAEDASRNNGHRGKHRKSSSGVVSDSGELDWR